MEYAGLVQEKSKYTGGRTRTPQQLTDHVRARITLVLVLHSLYSVEEDQRWQSIGIPDRVGYSTKAPIDAMTTHKTGLIPIEIKRHAYKYSNKTILRK